MTSSFRALKYKAIKLCATINLYPSADLWIQLLSLCNGYVQCHDVQSIVGSSSVSCSSLTSAATVLDRAPRKALVMRLQLLDDNPQETKEVSHFVISSRTPLTFHIYRRGAAYTCSGFGWVALSDVTQMYAESPCQHGHVGTGAQGSQLTGADRWIIFRASGGPGFCERRTGRPE